MTTVRVEVYVDSDGEDALTVTIVIDEDVGLPAVRPRQRNLAPPSSPKRKAVSARLPTHRLL